MRRCLHKQSSKKRKDTIYLIQKGKKRIDEITPAENNNRYFMFFMITNNIIKTTERIPALVPENIRLQINNIEDIDKDEFRLKIRIKKIELSITLYPLAINPE